MLKIHLFLNFVAKYLICMRHQETKVTTLYPLKILWLFETCSYWQNTGLSLEFPDTMHIMLAISLLIILDHPSLYLSILVSMTLKDYDCTSSPQMQVLSREFRKNVKGNSFSDHIRLAIIILLTKSRTHLSAIVSFKIFRQ
jgi:hypothetical protein